MSTPNLREQIAGLVSEQLIALLERAFSARDALPSLKDTDREIGYKLGQIAVVDFLRACVRDAGNG